MTAATGSVVLLHGLARTHRCMRTLGRRLGATGLVVRNVGYPSTRAPFEALVERVESALEAAPRAPVHVVTHSLGGILLRALLARHRPPTLGRVVMLAPPNHGSEIVDHIGRMRWFRAVFGPFAHRLGTTPDSIPSRLPPADFELGVIAGDLPLQPLGWLWVPRPSDGTVSVASTRLDGMRDHIVVHHGHALIMAARDVGDEVGHFLDHGVFSPGARRVR
ncbi:MAG: alpha/beta hydrolase [Chromatiales bacterium]|nr:alpha/beta hydrolase [Chromatiales bacterium]